MDKLTRWQGRFERRLETLPVARDGAHDIGHCRRVWQLAKRIAADADQDVDPLVLLAAAYFHDVVSVTKNHPQRSNASRLAARKARAILTGPARLGDTLSLLKTRRPQAQVLAGTCCEDDGLPGQARQ
jgi:HD superfamily phosphodiesterase